MTLFGVALSGGGLLEVYADGYRRTGGTLILWRWHDRYGDVWQHDIATIRDGQWLAVFPIDEVPPCSPPSPSASYWSSQPQPLWCSGSPTS